VIQDTCTLSSSVNKCITICTPSIYLVVRLANPLTYLVSDAGTVKGYRVATISWFADKRFVLLPSLLLFLSIILLHCILRYSYSISFYFELAHEQSIRHSIRHSHSILQVVDIRFDSTTTNLLLHDCLATASLPFSLIRQEHLTKTNTSRILLFNTRCVRTSKRLNLEA